MARAPQHGRRAGDVCYVTLVVPDLAAAQVFYASVLGWTFTPGRVERGAEVTDVRPMVGLWGDDSAGGRVGAVLAYRVDDLDAAVAAVRDHGGSAADPTDEPYGRSARCTDPSNLPLYLQQLPPAEPAGPDARPAQGDLSYVSFGMPDADRAFYAAVLGWAFGERGPVGVLPETGVWSPGDAKGTQQLGNVLCYQVDDIDAAIGRLRAAGGRCDEPAERPYGREVHGCDDQGVELYLHQLAD